MKDRADQQPTEHRPAGRPRTGWPAGVAIFALLLLVAFGARRPPGTEADAVAPSLNLPLAEALLVLGALTALFVVVLLLSALLAGGTSLRLPPRKEGWIKRTLVVMAVFAVVAFAFSFFPELEPSEDTPPVAEADGAGNTAADAVPWRWVVLGAGLVAGLTVGWFATRHSTGPGIPIRTLSDEPNQARREPPDLWTYEVPPGDDPRSRVIQHYAAMEIALGQSGRPRLRSEAPFEYAERIARSLPSERQRIATLTRLFVRARFSEHVIDVATERQAAHELATLTIETKEVNA